MTHNYKKFSYQDSLMQKQLLQLQASLQTLIKKVNDNTISAKNNEKKYLEKMLALCKFLDSDVLPIFSKGKGPSFMNAMTGMSFSNQANAIAKLKITNDIETEIDLELALCLERFMVEFEDKELIEVAPFFNPESLGDLLTSKLQELGFTDLVAPLTFKSGFNKKLTELRQKIHEYRAKHSISSANTPETVLIPSPNTQPEPQPEVTIEGEPKLNATLAALEEQAEMVHTVCVRTQNEDLLKSAEQLKMDTEAFVKKEKVTAEESETFKVQVLRHLKKLDEKMPSTEKLIWIVLKKLLMSTLNILSNIFKPILQSHFSFFNPMRKEDMSFDSTLQMGGRISPPTY